MAVRGYRGYHANRGAAATCSHCSCKTMIWARIGALGVSDGCFSTPSTPEDPILAQLRFQPITIGGTIGGRIGGRIGGTIGGRRATGGPRRAAGGRRRAPEEAGGGYRRLMRGLGTVVNVSAVLAGSVIGLLVGTRLPERIRETAFQGVGLVVLVLGVQQALATHNFAFPLTAIILGGVLGEVLTIEQRLERLGDRLRRLFERTSSPQSTFVEGFVSATLIFCVGPLTILGSISDGLGNGAQLLYIKSALDGTVSVVLASTLGIGVALSAASVLLVQGSMTLAASALHGVLTSRMVVELTSTGGILIVAIGLRLLNVARVRVGNFLPALVIAPIAVALFAR